MTNTELFKELMGKVKREGIDDLMDFLSESDFYEAPASSQFHLSCEGGLLQHSLNVCQRLFVKKHENFWDKALSGISDESLVIMSLLHDVCKVNYYVKGSKNQKTYDPEKYAAAERWQKKQDARGNFIWESVMKYDVEDSMPLGHGEKSVIIISRFIRLTDEELFAIRWHMAYSEEKSTYKSLDAAIEKYPVILALHEADLEASKLMEGKDGNLK